MVLLEIRTVLVLFLLLLIPGWAFLTVTRVFEKNAPLQRWILATAIGISFYPILFYFSRSLLPSFRFGERKIIFLLLIFSAVIIWGQRKSWRSLFAFDRMEWLAILVFAAAIFTRLWMAHLHPYPAWADSLHHTLLTQLVASTGQLPHTLLPYEPSSLDMYHLGLYALSGPVQMLSHAPAHTALLWTSQLLNGLCVLGVYFILDAKGSRLSAITGAVVVGLLSFQPAWYVNWGRFTQVASQSVLLVACIVTWEAIRWWRESTKPFCIEGVGFLLAAGILNAGVFLFHFRVAGLFLPLVAIIVGWEFFRGLREGKTGRVLLAIVLVGIVALVFILPALIPSLKYYIQTYVKLLPKAGSTDPIHGNNLDASLSYYDTSLRSIFDLGSQAWLVALAVIALIIGVVFTDSIILIMLLWLILLWGIGNAYRLGFFWLSIMNFSGILIMYYLPISVVVGRAIHILIKRLSWFRQNKIQQAFITLILFAGFLGSHYRVSGVEEYRYFVTPADLKAMDWIRVNTPDDAIFAINTYNWLGTNPHGTDGGYWIPYFTGRKTNTGDMLATLGPKSYVQLVQSRTKAVENLKHNYQSIDSLCSGGIQYIYNGVKGGNFTGPGFDQERLLSIPDTRLIYQENGVSIYKICR